LLLWTKESKQEADRLPGSLLGIPRKSHLNALLFSTVSDVRVTSLASKQGRSKRKHRDLIVAAVRLIREKQVMEL